MIDLSRVHTCFEVTEDLVADALLPSDTVDGPTPRERVFALLDHMARIARPGQGAAKILLVLARVATCDWIEGDLEARVVSVGEGTSIELLVHDGLSVAKLHAPFLLASPFEEMRKAVAGRADLLRPLIVSGSIGVTKVRLVAKARARRKTVPPPMAAAAALFEGSWRRPPSVPEIPAPDLKAPLPPPSRSRMSTILGFGGAEPLALSPPPAAPPSAPAAALPFAAATAPAVEVSPSRSLEAEPAPLLRGKLDTILGVPEPAVLGRIQMKKARVAAPRAPSESPPRRPSAPPARRSPSGRTDAPPADPRAAARGPATAGSAPSSPRRPSRPPRAAGLEPATAPRPSAAAPARGPGGEAEESREK